RFVQYSGQTEIAGVLGTASPVNIRFVNTAGSIAEGLLPTGSITDIVTAGGAEYTVTLIDNGQPLVIIRAEDLGVTGYESVAALSEDSELKTRVEQLRLAAAEVMGLGDVTEASYPKMTLVAPPVSGGVISTRSFIPHRVHESIGVLAAVTVPPAWVMEGSLATAVGSGRGGH